MRSGELRVLEKENIRSGNSNDRPWAYCSPCHSPPGLLINRSIFWPGPLPCPHDVPRCLECFNIFRWISHAAVFGRQHTLCLHFGHLWGLPQRRLRTSVQHAGPEEGLIEQPKCWQKVCWCPNTACEIHLLETLQTPRNIMRTLKWSGPKDRLEKLKAMGWTKNHFGLWDTLIRAVLILEILWYIGMLTSIQGNISTRIIVYTKTPYPTLLYHTRVCPEYSPTSVTFMYNPYYTIHSHSLPSRKLPINCTAPVAGTQVTPRFTSHSMIPTLTQLPTSTILQLNTLPQETYTHTHLS